MEAASNIGMPGCRQDLPGGGKRLPKQDMLSARAGSGNREMLTYYDSALGRNRIKRRYVWAAWAFVAGLTAGVLVAHL